MSHSEPHSSSSGSLPPGQYVDPADRIQHYGPVPRFKPESWQFLIFGATESGTDLRFDMQQLQQWTHHEVTGDLHCAKGWTTCDLRWGGARTHELVELAPPAADVTQVVAWGEYGYSANMSLSDFLADTSLLATHLNGEVLLPERGYPLRLVLPHLYAWKGPKWLRAIEYVRDVDSKRGFWEQRGYHWSGNPWKEERYSYLE